MKKRSIVGLVVVASCCFLLLAVAAPTTERSPGAVRPAHATRTELRSLIDPAVRYQRRTVADEDNAYPLVIGAAALQATQTPLSACRGTGVSTDDPEWPATATGAHSECIDRVLAANRPALEALERALTKVDLQFPRSRTAADFPPFAAMRSLALLLVERAQVRLRDGNAEGAQQDILRLLHYARLCQGGDGALIHFLVGLGIDRYALAAAHWYAAQPNVEEASLRPILQSVASNEQGLAEAAAQAYLAELDHFAVQCSELIQPSMVSRSGFDAWAAYECARDLECLQAVDIVFNRHPNAFDFADTLRLASTRAAATIRAARAAVSAPIPGLDVKLVAELAVLPAGWRISEPAARQLRATLVEVDNPVGKWLVLKKAPSPYLDSLFSHRTRARATYVLLALRAYQLRTGRWPTTLDELRTAAIVPAVPSDPYSGAPLGYSNIARSVWSVGPERGPNGGAGCGPNGTKCVWNLPDAAGAYAARRRPPGRAEGSAGD